MCKDKLTDADKPEPDGRREAGRQDPREGTAPKARGLEGMMTGLVDDWTPVTSTASKKRARALKGTDNQNSLEKK